MLLARLYEQHADECARAAETAEDPKRRNLLSKLAHEWRRDADKLRQQATEDGARTTPSRVP
jgi:hypothetical protein